MACRAMPCHGKDEICLFIFLRGENNESHLCHCGSHYYHCWFGPDLCCSNTLGKTISNSVLQLGELQALRRGSSFAAMLEQEASHFIGEGFFVA